jgi:hypothetical protein
MAELKDIAQQLAIACLSNERFVERALQTPAGTRSEDYAKVHGEKVGEFYKAILTTLQEET